MFFGVPREFYETTAEFLDLRERLEGTLRFLSDSVIEKTPPFEEELAAIRLAWKKFQDTEDQRAEQELAEQQQEQLAIAVLHAKASYFDLPPEDQDKIFDFVTEIAFTQGHEHQQKAGQFLARLQREATRISQNNQQAILGVQQAILETQQGMETTLTNAMSAIQRTQVSLEIQQLIIRNQVAIDAEIEERYKSLGHVERFRRGTQLRVKISQEVQALAMEIATLVYTEKLKNFSFNELLSYKLNQALSDPETALRSYRTDIR